MKYFITGTRRGLGKALEEKYGNCDSLEECDIFINCKHNGFEQVELLYEAVNVGKRVVNIGSYASDWIYNPCKKEYKYGVEKNALRNANSQLFDNGYNVTCLNLGYFDSEGVAHINKPKMSLEYVVNLVDWVLEQPHRIKDLTISP